MAGEGKALQMQKPLTKRGSSNRLKSKTVCEFGNAGVNKKQMQMQQLFTKSAATQIASNPKQDINLGPRKSRGKYFKQYADEETALY